MYLEEVVAIGGEKRAVTLAKFLVEDVASNYIGSIRSRSRMDAAEDYRAILHWHSE
jgi:hypothetical protein